MAQRHIEEWKSQRKGKAELECLITQKRKNLEHLLAEQKEKEFDAEQYSRMVDERQKRYEEEYEQLHALRMNLIQLKSEVQSLEMDLPHLLKSKENLQGQIALEGAQLQSALQHVKVKQEEEKKEITESYEQACARHLSHIEALFTQKNELIQKFQEHLKRKKQFEEVKKSMKDDYDQQLRNQHQIWTREQKEKREKWEAAKYQEILQNTLKGIEPEISRIVGASREEIKKIQDNNEQIKAEFRREMTKEFESKVMEQRRMSQEALGLVKRQTGQRYGQSIRRALQRLEEEYGIGKKKWKAAKEEELKQIEQKRKREMQEFMHQNKDDLTSHFQEVKRVKGEYEQQIKALDGSLDRLAEKEESKITQRIHNKLEQYREQAKKTLQTKIKAFHEGYRQKNQLLYEQIIQKVAFQNQQYESQMKLSAEQRAKLYREAAEEQIKKIRKNILALQSRFAQQEEALKDIKAECSQAQEDYEEAQRDQLYSAGKLAEYQAELARMKTEEGGKKKEGLSEWDEAIELMLGKIEGVEKEMRSQEVIMREKSEESQTSFTKVVNELQANSLQLLRKRNEQINRAKKEKELESATRKTLQETKKKLQLKSQGIK